MEKRQSNSLLKMLTENVEIKLVFDYYIMTCFIVFFILKIPKFT